ncbi:unnamed protein product [Rangifer tarandus platyrhynchus]|uniref:Microfibrillar-associated protein 2 n=1 Tax=Rangifer tarandus platyrhynchus TaxID=3082113 RepID=A0ABN8YXV6_RANTA|nr:unnamed protein product [Rangifer tarandus platyrhynchus]
MRAASLLLLILPGRLAQGQHDLDPPPPCPDHVQYTHYSHQMDKPDYYDYPEMTPRPPEEQFQFQSRQQAQQEPCKQCLNAACFYSLRRVYVVSKEICVRTVCSHEELPRADLCRDKFSKCGVLASKGCGPGACHSHSPSLGPPPGPQGGSRRASLCPRVGDIPGALWDLGPRRASLIPRQDHPSPPREFTTISASGNKLLPEARFFGRGIWGCLAAQIQATLPRAHLSPQCDGKKAPWYLVPRKRWSRLSTTHFHMGQLEFWKRRLSCSSQVTRQSFFHCPSGGKRRGEGEMATAMLATWRGARQGGRRLRQCPLCPRGLKTRRFLPPFPVNSIDLCSSKLSEGEDPGFICEGFLQTLFTAALAPFLPPTHALSLSSGYGLAPVLFEKSVAVRTSLHTLALRPPPGFSLQPLPPHPDVAGPACAQPPLSPCPGALASFTHLSVHSFSNSGTASSAKEDAGRVCCPSGAGGGGGGFEGQPPVLGRALLWCPLPVFAAGALESSSGEGPQGGLQSSCSSLRPQLQALPPPGPPCKGDSDLPGGSKMTSLLTSVHRTRSWVPFTARISAQAEVAQNPRALASPW